MLANSRYGSIVRGNILGVHVSAIDIPMALSCLDAWIQSRQPHYVCVTPAHSVMDCYDHRPLRDIFNHSGLTTPDGMAIVWLLHAKGYHFVERVYGPDLMRAVCHQGVEKGYRHYFYGGPPEVGEKLAAVLTEQFPGLQIVGVDSPPFRKLTAAEVAAEQTRIRDAQPDIVWVGIGSPRQEIWMSEHIDQINVPVLVGVGAAFDFLSGNKRQAPGWIQRSGLEWFYRLVSEPGRLWRRYLLGYPRFVVLVTLQALGLLRFE